MITPDRPHCKRSLSALTDQFLSRIAGQTTIKARTKFFYFTSIIVAGQKTTLLKVGISNYCTPLINWQLPYAVNSRHTKPGLLCSSRSTFLRNSVIQECALPSTVQAGALLDSPRYALSVLCTSCMLCKGLLRTVREPHLQELYDPNQLQVQLDEQADFFINRQASQCLPSSSNFCLLACMLLSFVIPEVSF